MERFLRPERFDCSPDSQDATKNWTHWNKTFNNFIASFPRDQAPDRLHLLTNYVAPSVYEYIALTMIKQLKRLKNYTLNLEMKSSHVIFLQLQNKNLDRQWINSCRD